VYLGCLRAGCQREYWELIRRKKLCIKKLIDFYSSPNIIKMIKLLSTRWEGCVVRTRACEISIEFWSENLKGEDHMEDLSMGGRYMFK
jgi:hypothetical protein